MFRKNGKKLSQEKLFNLLSEEIKEKIINQIKENIKNGTDTILKERNFHLKNNLERKKFKKAK